MLFFRKYWVRDGLLKNQAKYFLRLPAFRVYLLDANGTGIPDVIILNAKKGLLLFRLEKGNGISV